MAVLRENVVSVGDDLKTYDYLAKENDYINIVEWSNGEGWNISINDDSFMLTRGQLEAINYLTKVIEYGNTNNPGSSRA